MDQNKIWSKRYSDAGQDYLFGTEPNRFLARREQLLQDGRGAQGRRAVHPGRHARTRLAAGRHAGSVSLHFFHPRRCRSTGAVRHRPGPERR